MENLKFVIVGAELALEDVVKVTVIIQITGNVHIKIKKYSGSVLKAVLSISSNMTAETLRSNSTACGVY